MSTHPRIDTETVDHIAELARLGLTDDQRELYGSQLERILDYIGRLSELDTTNVPPTMYPTELVNVMRADQPQPSLNRDDLLQDTPDVDSGLIRVNSIRGEPVA